MTDPCLAPRFLLMLKLRQEREQAGRQAALIAVLSAESYIQSPKIWLVRGLVKFVPAVV